MRARSTRPVASVRERAILANAQHWSGSIESVMTRRAATIASPGDARPLLTISRIHCIRPYNISTIWNLCTRLFFKTDPFALEKAPHGAVARRCAALSQFGHHRAQGQIRLLGDPRQQPLPFAVQQQLFPAAHRLGRRAAARPPALRPLDNMATLTPNSAAVARHVRPLATEPITRSRRSCE